MRTVKFRAWDKDKQWMVYDIQDAYDGIWSERNSDEINDYYSDISTFQSFTDEESFNFMQYTGLNDKNGVEIYEGDIIQIYADNGFYTYEIVEEVVFNQGQYGIEYGGLHKSFYPLSDFYKPTQTEYISNVGNVVTESEPMFEVIGNVYENPEQGEPKTR